jgi:hypothetical protein
MRVAVADCCLLLKLKSSPIMVAVKHRHLQQACRVAWPLCQPNQFIIVVDPLLVFRLSRTLAVSVSPLTSFNHSIHSINQCTPVQHPFSGSSILPKITITIALLCSMALNGLSRNHGTSYRRSMRHQINHNNQWQCQLFPHQSFMGLGRFIASSSNCSS